MDQRSPILGLIVVCLFTATPAAAQDKRALIEKLMEDGGGGRCNGGPAENLAWIRDLAAQL
jgi:hypothetical protein